MSDQFKTLIKEEIETARVHTYYQSVTDIIWNDVKKIVWDL
jgi:hypothetical protein